ncbi:MAG: DUF177 domain-containing protein [Candidatus Actinomarina sp.]|nr:DUF177 domain-containing protein [Candidatus Actinomarina sp.]
MSKLNTVFNIDKVLNTNTDLSINEAGLLNIRYSGTTASQGTDALMTGIVTLDGDYLLLDLLISYLADSECSRCLKVSSKQQEISINEKLYIYNENEYDIDFNDENIDIYPIISEKVIDNISLVTLCSDECLGLCIICGKEQNSHQCKHEEKNLKESPFSSLSELDL